MTSTDEERQLTQYLLGTLSAGETERLEERAMHDGEVCARIAMAEEELLDRYARDELAAPDRQRLEARLLATPGQVARLRFATALNDTLSGLEAEEEAAHGSDLDDDASSTVLPWRQEELPSSRRRWTWWLPLAASVLLVIAASWLVRQNQLLRAERALAEAKLATLTAESEAAAAQLARLQAERPGSSAEHTVLEEEIRASRETIARLEEALAARPAGAAQAVVASFVLGLPTRSDEPATAYRVPTTADTIVLDLILDGGGTDYATFQALLRDFSGQEVWSRGGLSRGEGEAEAAHSVRLEIPAALLSAGEYELTLLGVDAAGVGEEVGFYDFPVARP